ncbi:glycosyl hydrolase [Devosia pacifica]|uniref:Glycosyl hydrolase n=1 Tax=Devosia pacifica TaxID=1335967 RepID=A0A918S7B4_9HYPH|nr:family 43 glycosylhydrolase [Devosia pacifica]GHA27990.1 glycosyl hydrolase [Devosia pacifica]
MSAPIYRDPEFDGAADPTVINRNGTDEWWMFYTNRRAHLADADQSWIHGSPIGLAVSVDGGQSFDYRGTVEGLDAPADKGLNTHWAPEVIWGRGEYHMYLTYMPGTPTGFTGVARDIVHFTSPDLTSWTRRSALPLPTTNAIDAAVALCPDGLYRLWYKDETRGSGTYSATSENLYDWQAEGMVIAGSPDAPPHEGPNVFKLGGWIWMITDEWHGQAVYRSSDAQNWTRQGVILGAPGAHEDDLRFARHADVVTQGDWAALYYFTHPRWNEAEDKAPETPEARATSIHVARLTVVDDNLVAERDIDAPALETGYEQI